MEIPKSYKIAKIICENFISNTKLTDWNDQDEDFITYLENAIDILIKELRKEDNRALVEVKEYRKERDNRQLWYYILMKH